LAVEVGGTRYKTGEPCVVKFIFRLGGRARQRKRKK
jgi:hypothetical protein